MIAALQDTATNAILCLHVHLEAMLEQVGASTYRLLFGLSRLWQLSCQQPTQTAAANAMNLAFAIPDLSSINQNAGILS